MFSGASQQLLFFVVVVVSSDGFQTIHIQAGMMRLEEEDGEDLEKIHGSFWFSSLSSLPVPVAACRAPELQFGASGVLSFNNCF